MTLEEIKILVASGDYRLSLKVQELIADGHYRVDDLVCCVLSATEIAKKERDERAEAVHGMKYVIFGYDTCGNRFYTAGKVRKAADGRFYFFMTAHAADQEL